MAFSETKRRQIYQRTDGKCHLCHKKLAFKNYGVFDARGAWEIEHSKAQANGGTHHLNNLYAACISCNRSKGAGSTQSARSRNGVSRAPYSKAKKERITRKNALIGTLAGMAVGTVFGTPAAILLCGTAGGLIGNNVDPESS